MYNKRIFYKLLKNPKSYPDGINIFNKCNSYDNYDLSAFIFYDNAEVFKHLYGHSYIRQLTIPKKDKDTRANITQNLHNKKIFSDIVEFGAVMSLSDINTYNIIFKTDKNINIYDTCGKILLWACKTQNIKLVDFLLSMKININYGDGAALLIACESQNVIIIQKLIKYGINIYSSNNAAFKIACIQKNQEILDILIEKNETIILSEKKIFSYNSKNGNYKNYKYNNISTFIQLYNTIINLDASDLLKYAIIANNLRILNRLIYYSIKINQDLLSVISDNITIDKNHYRTVFHDLNQIFLLAIEINNNETIKILLEKLPVIDISYQKNAPIKTAIYKNNLVLINFFLHRGILVDDSILIYALQHSEPSLITKLLNHAKKVSNDVFLSACKYKYETCELIELLWNKLDKTSMTTNNNAIINSIKCDCYSTFVFLLENNIYSDIDDIIYLICEKNKPQLLDTLINHCDSNKINTDFLKENNLITIAIKNFIININDLLCNDNFTSDNIFPLNNDEKLKLLDYLSKIMYLKK